MPSNAFVSASFDVPNQVWNGQVLVDQLGIVWTQPRPTQGEAIRAGIEWLAGSQWKHLRWRAERVKPAPRASKEPPPQAYSIAQIVRACLQAGIPREEIVSVLRHLTGTPIETTAFTNWAYSVILSVVEEAVRGR
jgi:hypothetical protein